MLTEILKRKIKDKFIFLDANIFIRGTDGDTSSEILNLINELKESGAAVVTIHQVQGEVLRFANTREEYTDTYEYLTKTADSIFPDQADLFASFQLYIAVKLKDKNLVQKISDTDFLLGSMLLKWKDRSYIATMDHTGFPIFLYNREGIVPIDAGHAIHNIGFYSFDEEKYSNLIKKF